MASEVPAIVPLESVDEEAILALVRTGLGTGSAPRSREFWRWKHLESPFGPSPGLAAVVGDRVVALRVFSRWRFASGAGEHQAVRAVDTATHPDWRRRGLFRRLTAELVDRVSREGTSFVFNTPNRVSLRGYRELGWATAGRVPLAVRPLTLRGLFGRQPPPAAPAAVTLGRGIEELLSDPGLPRFLARLWEDEPRLHTVRAGSHLAWRYAQVPGIEYRAAWDLEGASGAVVIARPRRRHGRAEVALAEVLVGPGDDSVRRAVTLLGRLTAAARASGADYLIAAPSRRTSERRALRRSGFAVVPGIGPRLAVRPLARSAELPSPLTTGAWRWSLGDLELF